MDVYQYVAYQLVCLPKVTEKKILANMMILMKNNVNVKKNKAHHFWQHLLLLKWTDIVIDDTYIKFNSLPT